MPLEDTKDVNSFFGEQGLFLEAVLTPEEVYSRIDDIKIEDVLTEAKKAFVPEKLNLAIIGPYSDDKKFVKLLK